jgi:hypothetical protein
MALFLTCWESTPENNDGSEGKKRDTYGPRKHKLGLGAFGFSSASANKLRV